MNTHFISGLKRLLEQDSGSQVIEYSLILATLSVALIVALQGIDGGFSAFLARVATCLNTPNACA